MPLKTCTTTGFLSQQYSVYFPSTVLRAKGRVAMESPVGPIVANVHIEDFENKALRTPENQFRQWKRYVDDNFVIQT